MIGRLLRWLLKAVLALLLLAVALVLLFRFVHPPTSAFMLEQRLGAMLDGDFAYRNRYDWVPLEDISPQAAIAVIASEDQQFPFHAGFDFKSIREAVRRNATGHRVHGASTISQQVAKNLFLWSGRSYLRKGIEAGFTLLIEWLWPKERILEVYLNVAEFGRGIYGVEAAAQAFWRRPAKHWIPWAPPGIRDAKSTPVLQARDFARRRLVTPIGPSFMTYSLINFSSRALCPSNTIEQAQPIAKYDHNVTKSNQEKLETIG